MAVTGTETYRELITDALLDIGAATLGQSPDAEAMAHGLRHANRLLKSWSGAERLQCFTEEISLSLVNATVSYSGVTLSRPIDIMNIRYRDTNDIDLPMIKMTRSEYDELPQKDSAGIPTTWYYDKTKESPTLFVWPVKATVTTEEFLITAYRESTDIADEDDTVDLPVEGYDALVLSIAERLAPTYGSEQRKMTIKMDAREARDEFFASDNEGVVLFHAD